MNVLIVDDEKNIRNSISKFLLLHKIKSTTAGNALSALRILEEQHFDIIIADLKMPEMDGIEFFEKVKKTGVDRPFILISAHGQIRDAVNAIKLGVYDFIEKPFQPEYLLKKIQNAYEKQTLKRRILASEDEQNKFKDFIGDSKAIKEIKNKISKIAPTPSTVLITGESGTGKEITARYIHKYSAQKDGPFFAVHLAGLPENLIESELFGYEKGAFTGAEKRKPGYFELASGGTIFLDEIGEISKSIQVKLLRVLQEKSVRRLGGQTDIPLNIRIIAATNRDLEQEVTDSRFREDLFYRLNVIHLHIPPLRERVGDIPLICSSILKKLNKEIGKKINSISLKALAILKEHNFKGNIRELENILERAYIYAEKDITEEELEYLHKTSEKESTFTEPKTFKEHEVYLIKNALLRWDGNRSKTAKELGISRQTLLNKIDEYNIK